MVLEADGSGHPAPGVLRSGGGHPVPSEKGEGWDRDTESYESQTSSISTAVCYWGSVVPWPVADGLNETGRTSFTSTPQSFVSYPPLSGRTPVAYPAPGLLVPPLPHWVQGGTPVYGGCSLDPPRGALNDEDSLRSHSDLVRFYFVIN